MSFNKDSLNNSPRDPASAGVFLRNFYENFYLTEKHDSPDQSRTSLARRIKSLIVEGNIFPKRVLNIGSGPQSLEKQLLTHGGLQKASKLLESVEFISVDLAQIIPSKLLSWKLENVSHVPANATQLPFRDESFGLVVSNHAIDFCPQESAFKEAYRVLNDGGKAIFYLHHPSMIEKLPPDGEVRTFWEYLKKNNILFSEGENIKEFLLKVGFNPLEISEKHDQAMMYYWWEVVAEKRSPE